MSLAYIWSKCPCIIIYFLYFKNKKLGLWSCEGPVVWLCSCPLSRLSIMPLHCHCLTHYFGETSISWLVAIILLCTKLRIIHCACKLSGKTMLLLWNSGERYLLSKLYIAWNMPEIAAWGGGPASLGGGERVAGVRLSYGIVVSL